MIRHTASFAFEEGTSEEQVDELIAALLALEEQILEVEHIVWGRELSQRAGGHTHIVSMEFADRGALESFYEHPAHRQITERAIKPITASLLILDYEERTRDPAGAEDRS